MKNENRAKDEKKGKFCEDENLVTITSDSSSDEEIPLSKINDFEVSNSKKMEENKTVMSDDYCSIQFLGEERATPEENCALTSDDSEKSSDDGDPDYKMGAEERGRKVFQTAKKRRKRNRVKGSKKSKLYADDKNGEEKGRKGKRVIFIGEYSDGKLKPESTSTSTSADKRNKNVMDEDKSETRGNKCEVVILKDKDDDADTNTNTDAKPTTTMEDGGDVQKETKKGRTDSEPEGVGEDFFKVIVNSIVEEGKTPFEEETTTPPTAPVKRVLSNKFKWTNGLGRPPSPEPTEDPLEPLWQALELGRWENHNHSAFPTTLEQEQKQEQAEELKDSHSTEVHLTPAMLCSQGKHYLLLDEEIGTICKFCRIVKTEIQYVMPEFSENPFGKPDRNASTSRDRSKVGDLNLPDSDSESQPENNWCESRQGTVWELIPGVGKTMFQHQRQGFEFLWKTIAGSLDLETLKAQTSTNAEGTGCVISHAPGTGKTRLAIMFLHTYMMVYPDARPVIVAPRNMLLNWGEEFQKWQVGITYHNLNSSELSGKENEKVVQYLWQASKTDKRVRAIRFMKLFSWKKDRGVLGISYGLFKKLTKEEGDADFCRILLEQPGLFIFDEGHTLRNDKSQMWKAFSKIKTHKRIILSGTPFQNNFVELYNTFSLAVPKFGEYISASCKPNISKKLRCRKDDGKGEWDAMTSLDLGLQDGLTREQQEDIRKAVSPFVHVHKGNILKENLPGLKHSVVVLSQTKFQKMILDTLLRESKNCFFRDTCVSLVSVHPSLLPEKVDIPDYKSKAEKIRLDPYEGSKTRFLMTLLRFSDAIGEKCLIFAQFLEPLALIIEQLAKHYYWYQGKEVLYMDGSQDVKQRQSIVKTFNDPKSESKVLLASTKACSEGISLIGASRVVLLDTTWNPSVERQAICRAYRLGQKRVVYVYHLITSIEEKKLDRQTLKHRMSELVFFPNNKSSTTEKTSSFETDDIVLDGMLQDCRLKSIIKKIYKQNEAHLLETYDLF